jgi:hypothetical protein
MVVAQKTLMGVMNTKFIVFFCLVEWSALGINSFLAAK